MFNKFSRTTLWGLAFALFMVGSVTAPELSSAQTNEDIRKRVNEGTVRVMGGSVTGTYSKMIWEMAVNYNDDRLRVVPMLGHGSVKATEDLLYLSGVDAALVQSDVLDFMKSRNVYRNIESNIRLITAFFNEEVHVVARNGIETIQDLEGKKVSFGPASSGTFMTGSIVFDALEITVEAMALSHIEGLERLRAGEIDAMVRVSGAPVSFLEGIEWSDNLHLLDIPPIEGSYVTSTVTSEDYPGLIPQGDTVDTVAVVAVLAAYNWEEGHPRREKVQRFVDTFTQRVSEMQTDKYHPKWQQVDLNKDLPGWIRWQ